MKSFAGSDTLVERRGGEGEESFSRELLDFNFRQLRPSTEVGDLEEMRDNVDQSVLLKHVRRITRF